MEVFRYGVVVVVVVTTMLPAGCPGVKHGGAMTSSTQTTATPRWSTRRPREETH